MITSPLHFRRNVELVAKIMLICLIVLEFSTPTFASGQLGAGLRNLCSQAKQFLAVASMILVVLAGAVYGIGQILGAETRARAAVWATAMLTGAVIGIVIFLIVPPIVKIMAPSGTNLQDDPCGGASSSGCPPGARCVGLDPGSVGTELPPTR